MAVFRKSGEGRPGTAQGFLSHTQLKWFTKLSHVREIPKLQPAWGHSACHRGGSRFWRRAGMIQGETEAGLEPAWLWLCCLKSRTQFPRLYALRKVAVGDRENVCKVLGQIEPMVTVVGYTC